MFLKTQTVKKPNGKSYTYYRLAESYRENGKVKHRILAELGALKSPTTGRVYYVVTRPDPELEAECDNVIDIVTVRHVRRHPKGG